MITPVKTVSSILGRFDLAYDCGSFPDLMNGYYYPVDVRMHLFADTDRWAWVVELLGYNPRGGNLIDKVHFFGNCLTHGDDGLDNDDSWIVWTTWKRLRTKATRSTSRLAYRSWSAAVRSM
ncbi:hypothetical protein GCM10023205_60650 [Yinghuangia aomiensis]|uniref:Uncharacterized protein n=1 Tax=Yinghuangia aomiensis TaxID=676205 RepID=A0ABP9HZV2_9ACTN